MTRFVSLLFVLTMALPVGAAPAQPSNDAESIFNVGLTHLREGRPTPAVEEFRRAIRADTKNPYFYKGLGLALAQLNQYSEAIAAFRKALEINPYYVDVRNDLGAVLMLSGQRDQGKAEFQAAFNEPTNPSPEVSARNLGQAYFDEKNFTQAANWFRTSLNRNKSYPDAYLGLSDSLVALSASDEALRMLEVGVSAVPRHAPLLLALGEAYHRAGRFKDARVQWDEAVRQDPMSEAGRRAAGLLKSQ